MDMKEDQSKINVQIKWEGLPDEKDWTWHSLNAINNDVPNTVDKHLLLTRKNKIAKKARAARISS